MSEESTLRFGDQAAMTGLIMAHPVNTITFSQAGRATMTITHDGRLEAGPGLSQDEATQGMFKALMQIWRQNGPKTDTARLDWVDEHRALDEVRDQLEQSWRKKEDNPYAVTPDIRWAIDLARDKAAKRA